MQLMIKLKLNYMFRIGLFVVFISFFSNHFFSQEKSSNQVSAEFKIKIEAKGVVFLEDNINLTYDDFSAFFNFNFDSYRNEKSNRVIQILNGPKITLLSFNQMKARGLDFDAEIYQTKIGEEINNQEKELITLVNIGLGVKTVEAPY
jgi:hypothetical protein